MDANVAYYALHELKILPGEYMNQPPREKAFFIACVKVRIEKEKKLTAKGKR